jgi:hypothetical protein
LFALQAFPTPSFLLFSPSVSPLLQISLSSSYSPFVHPFRVHNCLQGRKGYASAVPLTEGRMSITWEPSTPKKHVLLGLPMCSIFSLCLLSPIETGRYAPYEITGLPRAGSVGIVCTAREGGIGDAFRIRKEHGRQIRTVSLVWRVARLCRRISNGFGISGGAKCWNIHEVDV